MLDNSPKDQLTQKQLTQVETNSPKQIGQLTKVFSQLTQVFGQLTQVLTREYLGDLFLV